MYSGNASVFRNANTEMVLFTVFLPETLTKRQATQHGCLPSLLCDGDKGIEIVYGEEKNILY
jgi:hypothetical protein